MQSNLDNPILKGASYRRWKSAKEWSTDQALLILTGLDPDSDEVQKWLLVANAYCDESLVAISIELIEKCVVQLPDPIKSELVKRRDEGKPYFEFDPEFEYLRVYKKNENVVGRILPALVEDRKKRSSRSWLGYIKKHNLKIFRLKSELSSKSKNKKPNPKKQEEQEKPVHPKEKKSMLLIIAALCNKRKLDLEKNWASARELEKWFEKQGIGLKEGAISKFLEQANYLFREEEKEAKEKLRILAEEQERQKAIEELQNKSA